MDGVAGWVESYYYRTISDYGTAITTIGPTDTPVALPKGAAKKYNGTAVALGILFGGMATSFVLICCLSRYIYHSRKRAFQRGRQQQQKAQVTAYELVQPVNATAREDSDRGLLQWEQAEPSSSRVPFPLPEAERPVEYRNSEDDPDELPPAYHS
jgi:hypothetical protein